MTSILRISYRSRDIVEKDRSRCVRADFELLDIRFEACPGGRENVDRRACRGPYARVCKLAGSILCSYTDDGCSYSGAVEDRSGR
jgi:hypothetical protein